MRSTLFFLSLVLVLSLGCTQLTQFKNNSAWATNAINHEITHAYADKMFNNTQPALPTNKENMTEISVGPTDEMPPPLPDDSSNEKNTGDNGDDGGMPPMPG